MDELRPFHEADQDRNSRFGYNDRGSKIFLVVDFLVFDFVSSLMFCCVLYLADV